MRDNDLNIELNRRINFTRVYVKKYHNEEALGSEIPSTGMRCGTGAVRKEK